MSTMQHFVGIAALFLLSLAPSTSLKLVPVSCENGAARHSTSGTCQPILTVVPTNHPSSSPSVAPTFPEKLRRNGSGETDIVQSADSMTNGTGDVNDDFVFHWWMWLCAGLGMFLFLALLFVLGRDRRRLRLETKAATKDIEMLRRSLPPRPKQKAWSEPDDDVEAGLLGSSEDLAELNQRLDATLANEVAIEGWLQLKEGTDFTSRKVWPPGPFYMVLWSVDAELRFYESMAPSSFGNVHISEQGVVAVGRLLTVEAVGAEFSIIEQGDGSAQDCARRFSFRAANAAECTEWVRLIQRLRSPVWQGQVHSAHLVALGGTDTDGDVEASLDDHTETQFEEPLPSPQFVVRPSSLSSAVGSLVPDYDIETMPDAQRDRMHVVEPLGSPQFVIRPSISSPLAGGRTATNVGVVNTSEDLVVHELKQRLLMGSVTMADGAPEASNVDALSRTDGNEGEDQHPDGVVKEGWLVTQEYFVPDGSSPSTRSFRRSGRKRAKKKGGSRKLYMVLFASPEGELRLYENVVPASFGNVYVSEQAALRLDRDTHVIVFDTNDAMANVVEVAERRSGVTVEEKAPVTIFRLMTDTHLIASEWAVTLGRFCSAATDISAPVLSLPNTQGPPLPPMSPEVVHDHTNRGSMGESAEDCTPDSSTVASVDFNVPLLRLPSQRFARREAASTITPTLEGRDKDISDGGDNEGGTMERGTKSISTQKSTHVTSAQIREPNHATTAVRRRRYGVKTSSTRDSSGPRWNSPSSPGSGMSKGQVDRPSAREEARRPTTPLAKGDPIAARTIPKRTVGDGKVKSPTASKATHRGLDRDPLAMPPTSPAPSVPPLLSPRVTPATKKAPGASKSFSTPRVTTRRANVTAGAQSVRKSDDIWNRFQGEMRSSLKPGSADRLQT